MTRSELGEMLAAKYRDLPPEDARMVVTIVLDAMSRSLAEGRRVEIRGFGSFNVHSRAARLNRNPRTGAPVQVPAKRVPHFKVGKVLKQRIVGE